jgi:hypothetical protein
LAKLLDAFVCAWRLCRRLNFKVMDEHIWGGNFKAVWFRQWRRYQWLLLVQYSLGIRSKE